ncbi:DUF3592 domain-containing protein [Thiorhodococcus minor]|uniref:DUF3592 domain-containing protein n=1 Tax=Thiorhodococcus minor TaxID=57489 RepID=A0A6M0K6X2_9GAMM|nr:DUF3592 domain-containing protein [Thiorhodococcus minor]NEV65091.1 DUF3592 domain-containing protein [Thiorhodococcus minor]
MAQTPIPFELRRLRRRITLLGLLLGTLMVLLLALGVMALVMSLMLDLRPALWLTLMSLLGVLLVWVIRRRVVGAAKRRLADAAWLLSTASPRPASLHFNQALVFEGVVCALLDQGPRPRHQAAILYFSKLEYPKQPDTEVSLLESETCRTVLVKLKDRYFDGAKLDQAAFVAEKRRFDRAMTGLAVLIGLAFGSVAGWALIQAWQMHQGLACSAASQQWPQTSAEILEVGVVEEVRSTRSGKPRRRWRPEITYLYSWDGKTQTSSQLGCVERTWADRAAASKIADAFEVGKTYPLHLDPSITARAILIEDDRNWIRDQRTSNLGLTLSLMAAWLIAHLLIRHLLVRINRDRLREIETMIGWPPSS